MVDIHVYVIPNEFWRDSLNSVSSDAVIESLSAGFVHVDPEITLAEIRQQVYEQLQTGMIPSEFCFLRIVGRCLAKVSEKQEIMLRAKSFLPPFTFSPDIYLIDNRVTKRGAPRSTGSNNSDGFSLPRLTPNGSNFGAPEGDPSPALVPKILNLNQSDLEPQKNIPHGPHNNQTNQNTLMAPNGYAGDIVNFDKQQPMRKSRERLDDVELFDTSRGQPSQRAPVNANGDHHKTMETEHHKTPVAPKGYAGDVANFDRQQPAKKSREQLDDLELYDPSISNEATGSDQPESNIVAVKFELTKRERAELEIRRKGLLKRLHELQEIVQQKRKEAYEYWRARFVDEKGRTPYLEDQASSLGKDIDNLHKKLVRQLGNNNSGDTLLLSRQLQVLKLRQTVDLLKLKVEEGHTKLMCQIRLRNQAETELRAMRAELTQKKVLVQLLKSKLPAGADVV